MERTVSAVVTWGEACLGIVGPFAVTVAWWAEVEPVAAAVREALGVPVLVLRLRPGRPRARRVAAPTAG